MRHPLEAYIIRPLLAPWLTLVAGFVALTVFAPNADATFLAGLGTVVVLFILGPIMLDYPERGQRQSRAARLRELRPLRWRRAPVRVVTRAEGRYVDVTVHVRLGGRLLGHARHMHCRFEAGTEDEAARDWLDQQLARSRANTPRAARATSEARALARSLRRSA